MPGIMVFKTLADALRAGYHVYDRTDHGYLVRTRTAAGWAMAIVSCRSCASSPRAKNTCSPHCGQLPTSPANE